MGHLTTGQFSMVIIICVLGGISFIVLVYGLLLFLRKEAVDNVVGYAQVSHSLPPSSSDTDIEASSPTQSVALDMVKLDTTTPSLTV